MTDPLRPPPRQPESLQNDTNVDPDAIRAAQREEDEQRVLRVRARYKPGWTGSKALADAAKAIREQAE